MTHPRRHTCAAIAACFAAGLLLTACSKSTPTAHAASAAQTTASTGATSAAPTNAASAEATPATATDAVPATSDAPLIVAPTDPVSADATPAATPSTGGTACGLVTQQEVAAALGTDPGPGSPITSDGASQCQYGTFQTALVLVNLNPSQGKPFYDHARNDPKLSEAGAVTDVAGVGDRAFGIFGHGTASIYFNKGDALVLVMVAIRTAPSPPKAQALALAKTAAGRV